MIVVFSERQLTFDPPFEIYRARRRIHPCCAKRIVGIREELIKHSDRFEFIAPKKYPATILQSVHLPEMVSYIRSACKNLRTGDVIIPSTFCPSRGAFDKPSSKMLGDDMLKDYSYFCYDTTTPLMRETYEAAYLSACCALNGAQLIKQGNRVVFALCHPPGHHAGSNYYGGYCYFNNAAIAANYLLGKGKVAILDIDYHHGNGTQSIFYKRSKVFYASIHGDPSITFPYFSGYASEKGSGRGKSFNYNLPLKPKTEAKKYVAKLDSALVRIKSYKPDYLILCVGLDIYSGDPEGGFLIKPGDFYNIGSDIGSLELPTLIVLEGGYAPELIGQMAYSFLAAFGK